MKEHKKMYKSGKKWLVATISISTLGIGTVFNYVPAKDVHADTSLSALTGYSSVRDQLNSPIHSPAQKTYNFIPSDFKDPQSVSKTNEEISDYLATTNGQYNASTFYFVWRMTAPTAYIYGPQAHMSSIELLTLSAYNDNLNKFNSFLNYTLDKIGDSDMHISYAPGMEPTSELDATKQINDFKTGTPMEFNGKSVPDKSDLSDSSVDSALASEANYAMSRASSANINMSQEMNAFSLANSFMKDVSSASSEGFGGPAYAQDLYSSADSLSHTGIGIDAYNSVNSLKARLSASSADIDSYAKSVSDSYFSLASTAYSEVISDNSAGDGPKAYSTASSAMSAIYKSISTNVTMKDIDFNYPYVGDTNDNLGDLSGSGFRATDQIKGYILPSDNASQDNSNNHNNSTNNNNSNNSNNSGNHNNPNNYVNNTPSNYNNNSTNTNSVNNSGSSVVASSSASSNSSSSNSSSASSNASNNNSSSNYSNTSSAFNSSGTNESSANSSKANNSASSSDSSKSSNRATKKVDKNLKKVKRDLNKEKKRVSKAKRLVKKNENKERKANNKHEKKIYSKRLSKAKHILRKAERQLKKDEKELRKLEKVFEVEYR